MDVIQGYELMLSRFNRKRDLHQKAHIYYKNRDMKMFMIPLMIVQFVCSILPQIDKVAGKGFEEVAGVMQSAFAAMSAIWLGFQGKKRYGERSESHKNAASIFQHLAVLSMVEKQRAKMQGDNNIDKFFAFQEMVQNLEGKAKDDEYFVPIKIVKAHKIEKEEEKKELKKKIAAGGDIADEDFSVGLKKLKNKYEKEMKEEGSGNSPNLPEIMKEELPAITNETIDK